MCDQMVTELRAHFVRTGRKSLCSGQESGIADYAWPGERAEVFVLCAAYQRDLAGLAGRRS